MAPSQYQEWVADHQTRLGSKIEEVSTTQFDKSTAKRSKQHSKNNPVEKLIELGKTARKFTDKLDKLVYSDANLDKKAENDLFEKLGRKAYPKAMPNATQFKTQLLSFQHELDQKSSNKLFAKQGILSGPKTLKFGKDVVLNLGIGHETLNEEPSERVTAETVNLSSNGNKAFTRQTTMRGGIEKISVVKTT